MHELPPVTCQHNGTMLEGKLAAPERKGPVPAVLVMHSAMGLLPKVEAKARLLADLGYLAVATDMYGKGTDHSSLKATSEKYAELLADPELLRSRVVAWFDAVAALPQVDPSRVAAIGYCFGGMCVLELARSGANARAVVSFHGILTTHASARPGQVTCEIAAWCGAKDPFAPPDYVEGFRRELAAAGARYQITEFADAEHSFTDPDAKGLGMKGISYNAIADKVSWAGTVALLAQVLA